MKTLNIYKHPQILCPGVIMLATDLQNTFFYTEEGELIGWQNHHKQFVEWLETHQDLVSKVGNFGLIPFTQKTPIPDYNIEVNKKYDIHYVKHISACPKVTTEYLPVPKEAAEYYPGNPVK